MAQGTIKSKSSKATPTGRKPNVLGPKKGARTIAPRKQALVRQDKMTKKLTAGLTAMTERTLGAKVGHLELLGGGKNGKGSAKQSKGKGKGSPSKEEGELERKKKGGSKNFG